MLGRVETNHGWTWSAYGKHPSARDYFKIGPDTPMPKALSLWVERGFDEIAARGRSKGGRSCWRFWTRDARTDNLVCGLLRDSADAVGRPYPFLVTGEGELPQWKLNWDLLSFACENAWIQMEQTAARLFSDVKGLEAQLQKTAIPAGDWDTFKERRRAFGECSQQNMDTLRTRMRRIAEADPLLSLEGISCDQFQLIGLCHHLLKANTPALPSAVFMGGPMDHVYAAFFQRPLNTSDFVRLWSLSTDNTEATLATQGI